MLNLSVSDFSVDARIRPALIPIPAPCATYLPIAHIRAKDRIEGVININKNTASKFVEAVRTPAMIGVGMLILCLEMAL